MCGQWKPANVRTKVVWCYIWIKGQQTNCCKELINIPNQLNCHIACNRNVLSVFTNSQIFWASMSFPPFEITGNWDESLYITKVRCMAKDMETKLKKWSHQSHWKHYEQENIFLQDKFAVWADMNWCTCPPTIFLFFEPKIGTLVL